MARGEDPPASTRSRSEPSAVTTPPVGAELRRRRYETGISVRELARRLDVSPSLVSQIETGRIQPSVRTLYAIVSELGISLDEIFELVGSDAAGGRAAPDQLDRGGGPGGRPDAEAGVLHRDDARRVIELETGVRWERIAAWEDPDVEFMVAVYGVGGSSSADGRPISHRGREFGIVLSGTLSVTVGSEDHTLEAGDSISFASTTPHRLRNDGSVEVRAIWVTLGRYGGE
jgi:transcriptional regulator with XRE-family HTH domain